MRLVSAISEAIEAETAVEQVCQQALDALGNSPVQLAFVFASTVYRTSWTDLVKAIQERLHPQVLIGCSGSGIIGGSRLHLSQAVLPILEQQIRVIGIGGEVALGMGEHAERLVGSAHHRRIARPQCRHLMRSITA